MPYELVFTKHLPALDREQYINDCCIGGDLVLKRLLPLVQAHYTDVQTNQEDWGWFIWFRDGRVKLAIDVHTDDPDKGVFRIHLMSRSRHLLWFDAVVDTPELEALRNRVESELAGWADSSPRVTRLDWRYM